MNMATAPVSELLDEEFLAHQRTLLEQERKARAEAVDMLAGEVRNYLRRRESDGEPEGFGTGETASVDLERARDQYARAAVRLTEVDAAWARLDRGTYGTCERCGGSIGRDRLDAVPAATRCILCQART
jgi:RNA polymerase-binding transcription factor DksA